MGAPGQHHGPSASDPENRAEPRRYNPKDLADLYEVEEGDQAEFEPLGERTFRIKLVRQERD